MTGWAHFKRDLRELGSHVLVALRGIWSLLSTFGRLLYMTLRRGESVWVIVFRGQVEILACTRPPTAHKSSVERNTVESVRQAYVNEDGRLRYKTTQIPKKLTIENTIHTGGRVLKTMSSQEFYEVTDSMPRINSARKLTKAQALLVLAPRPRRYV